jgi:hypothetical protein
MLEVVVDVQVEDGMIILPSGLPGCEIAPLPRAKIEEFRFPNQFGVGKCLALSVPALGICLRIHDHFMGDCSSVPQLNELRLMPLQKCHSIHSLLRDVF